MKKVSIVLAGIVASVVATASAAETQTASTAGACSDVMWKAEVLAKYPDIAKSCVDVVVREGVRYVKVSGKVRRNTNGELTVRLDHSNSDITWKPAAGDKLLIDGTGTSAADVKVGQNLRFYMLEDKVSVVDLTDAGAAPREVVP
jgi:hypothetical protein